MSASLAFAEDPPTDVSSPIIAPEKPSHPAWTIGGTARFRFETRNNRDLNSATSDRSSFVGSRIRLDLGFSPDEKLKVFIQPQFSHIWGQGMATLAGNGTITGSVVNSGGLSDPALGLHQAYANWQMLEHFSMILGRQEFNYGDEVVIGPVGFSNVGRSFDAIVFRSSHEKNTTDFFYSKLADDDVSGSGFLGESDFAGVYSGFKTVSSVDALDVYALYFRDRRGGFPTTFNFGTFGLRVKDKIGSFDYRLEGNAQAGEHLGNKMLAYMLDAEVGYTAQVKQGLRTGLEFNRASGDKASSPTFTRYHQLFPTVHRWLGYMDLFGRQNIQSGVLHASLKMNPTWSVAADVHSFWRVESQDVIYSIVTELPYAGQTSPPTTAKKHVGEEVDLIAIYRPVDFFELKMMGGVFLPGTYFKSSVGRDGGYFGYVQTTFMF